MKAKMKSLLAFVLIVACLTTGGITSAAETKELDMDILVCQPVDASILAHITNQAVTRASSDFSGDFEPNIITTVGNSFVLNVGDTIKYDCSYVSSLASVDFGFIAPDRKFYSVNCTTGSINTTIRVSQRGSYTLAIRNNSNSTVTVTGTVDY